ncbi:MAG: choice-of-anchor D domain-containing protein [Pseudomonadota bacterium]
MRVERWQKRALCTAALLGLATALSCAGCDDDELDRLRPILEFEPARVDFGPRALGQGHVETVIAHSKGSLDLAIEDVRIEPADAPFLVVNYPDFLPIAGSGEVTVTFTPGERGDDGATAVFTINVDVDNEVRLPLTGSVGPPRIEVTPAALDFGTVNQDQGSTLALRASNVGGDWLEISSISFVDATTEFSVLNVVSATSQHLAPGDYQLLHVRYVPDDMGADSNTLRITSNAENGPDTDVPVTAVGNLSPVVLAFEKLSGLSEVTIDPELLLTLSSEGTYDPEGQALTRYWQIITKPVGSTATLPSAERDTVDTHIEPGLVGDYVVRLLATDPQGAQGTADVTIHAIRDLVLVLRWETAADALCRARSESECAAMSPQDRQTYCCGQTDIDLHLVAPGGVVGDYLGTCPSEVGCNATTCGCVDTSIPACLTCRSKGLDCAYANRRPDWGNLGDPLDDPSLDVDDVRGRGPEVISLNGPVDGDYLVYAHFCNDRIVEPTEATIDVFIKGALLFSLGPVRLASQGKLWLGAILTKSGETWSGLTPASVTDADADLCTK